MTNREALNVIADMCNALQLNPNTRQGEAMMMAINSLKKGTSSAENNGEWIPVSKRLPDREKYSHGEIWERSVLVTSYFSWDDKKETFISYELAEDVIDNNFVDKRVITAWMTLPEPYKAER